MYMAQTQTPNKIQVIKEALSKAEEIAERMDKEAYEVSIIDSEDNRYLFEIRDSAENLVTSLEISEELVEKLEEEMEVRTLEHEIAEKIEEILKALKKQKIIEDYEIWFEYIDKPFGLHDTFTYADINITLHLPEELAKELLKHEEFEEYIDEENSTLSLTIYQVCIEHRKKVFTTTGLYEEYNIYTTKEKAEEILEKVISYRVEDLKKEGYEAKVIESEEKPEVYSPTKAEYIGMNKWIIYWPSSD